MNENEARERWAGVETNLFNGKSLESPFGRTEEGYEDFRGLVIDEPFRLDSFLLEACDLTYFRGHNLIFLNSIIRDCRFDQAKLRWGDSKCEILNVSFLDADISGATFGMHRSRFYDCNFSRSDLRGVNANRPLFEKCRFEKARITHAQFGNASFTSCVFKGKIKKCWFSAAAGSGFKECDLREASFVDCNFRRMKFLDCLLGDEMVIFQDWQSAQRKIADKMGEVPSLLPCLLLWNEIEGQFEDEFPTMMIGLEDMKYLFGAKVGVEVFEIAKRVSEES